MDIRELPRERPIVFFDLETTGVNPVTDRIVQLAAVKYSPGADAPERMVRLVRPPVPIPAETTAIHGIDAAAVADAPTFPELAEELLAFLGESDLAGYNVNRFDLPVLLEEFARAGIRFRLEGRRVVDVQEIFYRMEPRTLAGALRFYRGEELEGAHDALADVEATVRVLEGQLDRYAGRDHADAHTGEVWREPVRADVTSLHAFSRRPGQLDAGNRLREDEAGEPVFNFGKHKGRRAADVFRKEPSYYRWLQEKDFSVEVKEITRRVWEGMQS